MEKAINTFFFDCDSTLSQIEGIDELAKMKGVENQIIPLTKQAMDGDIPLSDVFGKRLEIIRPTQSDMEKLGELYIKTLIPDAKEYITKLLGRGKTVGIISAGYEIPLWILGEYLGITDDYIYANTIFFDRNGEYTGFDSDNPLCREDGKELIIKSKQIQSLRPILYTGDGVSDVMVTPFVDAFVGFGGVTIREKVKKQAKQYITKPSFSFLKSFI